jgi:hypothetical protein
MLERLSSGWFGVLVGVTGNEAAEAFSLCARMHLLADEESPDDVLPIAAKDRRLSRYHLETSAQHRARLINAWEIYARGGSEEATLLELDAAGYGPASKVGSWGASGVNWGASGYAWGDVGACIERRPEAYGPRGEAPPYWSQYWIVFGLGMHPVTGPPVPWGSFVWGDTYDGVWGPIGYSADFRRTILGIVRKWKPCRWVFRGFRFRIGELSKWGQTGFAWGQAGLVWGGVIDVEVPLS